MTRKESLSIPYRELVIDYELEISFLLTTSDNINEISQRLKNDLGLFYAYNIDDLR